MENETKQTLRLARVGTYATLALFAVVVAALLIAAPRLSRTLDRLDQTLAELDSLVETADAALTSATAAADSANELVSDNADAIAEAMEKFNSVDFETLNKAIADLSDVVEPLAKFSNFFNR